MFYGGEISSRVYWGGIGVDDYGSDASGKGRISHLSIYYSFSNIFQPIELREEN